MNGRKGRCEEKRGKKRKRKKDNVKEREGIRGEGPTKKVMFKQVSNSDLVPNT